MNNISTCATDLAALHCGGLAARCVASYIDVINSKTIDCKMADIKPTNPQNAGSNNKDQQDPSFESFLQAAKTELAQDREFCGSDDICGECRDSCKMLREAKLRPTRQRIALADLLFSKGDRHVSAELLFEEAIKASVPISLATVYNTLHQFTQAGLLKSISIDSSKTYFDTDTGNHHHFFLEGSDEVIDMPEGFLTIDNLPALPEGTELSSIDVVVRVRKK